MGKTLKISDLDNQLLSRTIDAPQGEWSTAFRVATPHVQWRLVVAEISGVGGILVNIDYAGPDNQYSQKFNVNPNGAEELSGNGPCNIQIAGVSADARASVELTDPLIHQGVYSQSTGYINATTWADLGTNGGYAPDFMNFMIPWVSGTFDLRVVDINGTVVATFASINPNDFIRFGSLVPVSKWQKFQIQSAGGVGNIDYRVTWFNRH